MFHIDFESEQTKNLINWAKYAATALVVVIVTIALVFAARGYDIDRETGQIIQNGLVLIASQPVSADVYINGNNEDDPTSSKFSLPSGQYTFELKRDGYHDWVKRVNIEGSEVVWLQYPRLIPTEITSANYQAFKDVNMASQTPDRKYLLVHEKGNGGQFTLLNLESSTSQPEDVILPEAVLNQTPGQPSVFEVIDWAQDNRTVVVQHTSGSVKEIIFFDVTKPEEALNLTSLYELTLTDLRFVDSANNKLYTIVGSSLRIADVGAQTITAALVDHVADYEPKDGIVVVLHGEDKAKVSVLDNNELFLFTDLAEATSKYLIATSIYDGERYLSVADNAQERVFIYENFVSTAKSGEGTLLVDTLRLANTKYLSYSPNGQFTMAQSGQDFRLYNFDIEAKRAFTAQQNISGDAEAEWVDGYHLNLIDKDGKSYFMDYDGLNPHALADLAADLGAIYDNDTEGLFFFATNSQGSDILKFSSLVVEQ